MRIIFFIFLSIFVSSTALAEAPGVTLPKVGLLDEQDTEIRLDQRKDTVHIINFWATWCAPCIHELPSLAKLARHYEDNDKIQLVLVNEDLNYEKSQKFIKDFDFPAKVLKLFDAQGKYLRAIGDSGLPVTIVSDVNGVILTYEVGAKDWNTEEIYTMLDQLSYHAPEQSWWQDIVRYFD